MRHKGVLALSVTLLMVSSLVGCYTRVTTPKEAFYYTDRDGSLPEGPLFIFAHEYNAILRDRTDTGDLPYVLQPGTLIDVEVYGQPIDTTVAIRPDGVVDLPLIGEVTAVGRTIQAFKEEVSTRYGALYVEPPQVILNTKVTENDPIVRAGEVSVIQPTGESGVVQLTGDEYLTQALAEIQALNPRSEWNQIAIIRRGAAQPNERYVIVSDLERYFKWGDFDQDVRLRNGDVIFIPAERNTLLQEFFATWNVIGTFAQNLQITTAYIDFVEGF